MDLQVKAALLSSLLLLNGCSTVGKSVMLGATVGGITGGVMGNSQNPQGGGGVGMAIGAGIGGLISYLAFKEKEKKSTSDKPNATSKSLEDDFPFLTKPKIRSVIIPDTIEGNKFIKSHKVYILEDAGSWSKD
jgi:hypothetical protein